MYIAHRAIIENWSRKEIYVAVDAARLGEARTTRVRGPRPFAPRPGVLRRHAGRPNPASSRRATRALLRDYHERGDLEARERLIQQHLPLVRKLARSYADRGEQLDDLVQVGSIGLINAIDRFELDRGVELAAYAIPSIVGEIKRHLRDRAFAIRVPRRLQALNLTLRASAAELAVDLARQATVAELASKAGVPKDEAAEALAADKSHQPLSLSAFPENGNENAGLERKVSVDGGFEVGEDRALLARGFRVLDARERRLLHLGYFQGLSQAQIAKEVGISQIHVSRLTRRALEKLRTEIGRD
jgi:RNA polymerase sigma-B factor